LKKYEPIVFAMRITNLETFLLTEGVGTT